jgi:hypothetical protein
MVLGVCCGLEVERGQDYCSGVQWFAVICRALVHVVHSGI